jgi:TonB-dependent receptor
MKLCKQLATATVALTITTLSAPVNAQTAPAASAGPAVLEEVVVTGVRASVKSALDEKKNADQLVDSIVSQDIGKFPDNNVIEALQHVTGIQISRNTSEPDQLLIRGLPDIATLLNGREIFTSNGRFVTLQDIPAELLQRVDVEKSSRADDIEGGIAGLIDVRLHRPFDFDGFEVAGTATGTHSSLSEKTDPRASLLLSNRWRTDAGEFGALVDVSYSKDRYRSEILTDYISAQPIGPVPGSTGPNGTAYLPLTEDGQSINGTRERSSIAIALQWSPNSSTDLYLEGFGTRFRNINNDDYFVGLPWLGANAATATVFPGTDEVRTVTAGGYDLTSDQSFIPRTDTYQVAMGGTWTGESIKVTSEVDFTDSRFTQSGYILDTEYYPPANGYTTNLNYNNTGTPYISVSGINLDDPSNFHIRQLYDQWQDNKGNEIDWRGDVAFKLSGSAWVKSIDTGVRIGDRFAQNREDNQGGLDCRGTPDAASPTNGALLAAMASPACFTALTALPGTAGHTTGGSLFNGAFGLTSWSDVSPAWLNSNIGYLRQLFDQSPTGAPPPADPTQSFDDREISYASYVKANFGGDLGTLPLVGNIGLRLVETHATMRGNSLLVSTPDNINYTFSYLPAQTIKNSLDWLPSLNARLTLEDGLFLRLALSRTVTRPNFTQIDPGLSLAASTATLLGSGTAGNPNLGPEKSNNADLSLEHYFGRANALTGAVFYRQIDGYVESAIEPQSIAGINYQITTYANAPPGHIDGAEVGYTQFFDSLPGLLNGLGVQANGTYVEGVFQNISKWSYNLIGIYEKGPVSFRLAYNWRSGFNAGPAPGGGMQPPTIFAKAQPWLDLSTSYTIANRLTVTFDATNLLNSYYQDYFGNQSVYPRDTRRFDQTLSLGLRYKL